MTQYQLDNAISAEQRAEFDQLLVQIIEEWAGELKNCPSYVSKVEKASPETRVNLLIFLIEQIRGWKLFKEGGPAYKSIPTEMRYTNKGTKRCILA